MKKIPASWFIVVPIAVTTIVLLAILTWFTATSTSRVANRMIEWSLQEISRNVEATIRTLMMNDPRQLKGYHNLLDRLRGERGAVEDLNRARKQPLEKLESAVRLIAEEADYRIADDGQIADLRATYGPHMQDLASTLPQPGIRTTIAPAPVVRDEMLRDDAKLHPDRYPEPDGIETLVIATGRQFRGTVREGAHRYLRITTPILADTSCMNCHLSVIEGQPMAAVTVRADPENTDRAVSELTRRVILFGAMVILIVLLVILLVSGYLSTMLGNLSRHAAQIADGDPEAAIRAGGIREIASIARNLETTRVGIHGFMHDILNHIPALFFGIDREGRFSGKASQTVQNLFGKIDGASVNEVVFRPQGKDMASLLESVFEAGATMSFEEMMALAPSEIQIEEQVYRLIYHPEYNNETLVKIFVIGENISALRKTEQARIDDRRASAAILEIVKNPIGFQEFSEESRRLLEKGQTIMNRDDGLLTDEELIEIQRIVHTIKGAAGTFLLESIVSAAHDFENQLIEMKRRKQAIGRKVVNPMLSRLDKEMETVNAIFQKHAGDQETADRITITKAEAKQIVERHPDLKPEVARWHQKLQIDFVRRKASGLVRATAARLGKEVKLEVSGEEGRISDRTAETISLSLTHLLRNAVGHGIEDPEVREAVGKWPQGNVRIHVTNRGNNVQLNIRDDGKGMHPEDLVNSAINKGILKKGTRLPPQKALNLVFHSGFSTSSEISSNDGLGVGLDAVKHAIKLNKGLITVRSEAGLGTEFIVIMHRDPQE